MKEHYEDLLENGFEFDYGKFIDGGWNIFKEKASSYIGYFWLSIILFILAVAIFIIPVIGTIGALGLFMAIQMGYFTFTKAQLNESAEFSNFFDAFKNYWQLLINILFLLIIFLPIYIVMFFLLDPPIGVYMDMINNPENIQASIVEITKWSEENRLRNMLVQYGSSIIIGIINTLFMFSYMFIIDKGMKATDALWLSRKIVSKRFLNFIIMAIAVNAIVFAGILFTCFIGTMVVVPLSMCINYFMYDSICNNKEVAVIT